MPSSSEAVGYIQENVGLLMPSVVASAAASVYENVGIIPKPLSPEAVASIYEYLVATAPIVPHLWKVHPGSGLPADQVEIWGQGWIVTGPGGDYVKFYLSNQPGWNGSAPINAGYEMVQVSPPTFVAATGNAYNALRSIPPGDGEPNVEHWKVVVVVPLTALAGSRPIRAQVLDNP